jgi:hypothetical protein
MEAQTSHSYHRACKRMMRGRGEEEDGGERGPSLGRQRWVNASARVQEGVLRGRNE